MRNELGKPKSNAGERCCRTKRQSRIRSTNGHTEREKNLRRQTTMGKVAKDRFLEAREFFFLLNNLLRSEFDLSPEGAERSGAVSALFALT
jgi:hypothetical protein